MQNSVPAGDGLFPHAPAVFFDRHKMAVRIADMPQTKAVFRKAGANRIQKRREAIAIGEWMFRYVKDPIPVFPFRIHADDLHGISGRIGEGLKTRGKRLKKRLRSSLLLFFLLPGKLSRTPALFLPAAFGPVFRGFVFFKIPAVFPETVMLLQKLLRQFSGMQQIMAAADDA